MLNKIFNTHPQKEFFHTYGIHNNEVLDKVLAQARQIKEKDTQMDIIQTNASIFTHSFDNGKASLNYLRVEGARMDSSISQVQDQLKHIANYLKGNKIKTNVTIYNIFDSQDF